MPTLRSLGLLISVFATLTVYGQQPPTEASNSATPIFSTGANLVPVKVVVRDKKGSAVGDLTKSDFILQDNRKVQIISRFSVVKSEIPAGQVARPASDGPAPLQERSSLPPIVIPTRFIAYVFDDVNTDIADLMRSREAAVKSLADVMDPATRIAVYTTSGQTKHDFSGDLEALKDTMLHIRRWSAEIGGDDCPAMNFYWASRIIDKGDDYAFSVAVAEYLACHPELTGDTALDIAKGVVRATAFQSLSTGQRESNLGLGIVSDIAQRMSVLPGERLMVLVSAGFLVDQTLRFNEQHVLEIATKAKVIVNSLDARGVYSALGAFDASKRGVADPAQAGFHMLMDRDIAFQRGNVLIELANGTGGLYISNSNAYEQGFRKLTASREVTYMLGFSPKDIKYDGKYHSLDVKLKPRPGLDVKSLEVNARAGYFAPSAKSRSEQAIKEEIREAAFAREEIVNLPVELSLRYSKSEALEAILTLSIKIDVAGLHLSQEKDRHTDVLIIVTAIFDQNGVFVKGQEHVVNLKLREETRARMAEQGLNMSSEMSLPSGNYLVRLVVRDNRGNTMATRNGVVEIPN